MSESQWDDAARKAADSVYDWYDDPDEEHRVSPGFAIPILQKKIAEAHADLRATYELLVELVEMQNAQRIHRESFMPFQNHVDSNKHNGGVAINARLAELYSNPLVQAAIERRNDKERG